ncbi:hypothetical protein CA265_12585 [Sphingobacteriaceae bacterium GW460-11-11-14-LB5]|nr:hypothetical protein CA265_12585 [Sphingobacteriaceae bacterium GW460-11-11-14-LB5]
MSQYSNAVAVTRLLLKTLFVKHSVYGLTQKLEDHPEYPSLLSISDCLTEWQVANAAINIDKTTFKDINCPFVAHFASNGGSFILVQAVNDQEIVYSDEKKQKAILPIKEFLQKWSGTVLLAEADKESKEPEYGKNKWKDLFQSMRLPILIITIVLGIILALLNTSLSAVYFVLLIINLFGVSVTSLLLINSIGSSNPLVQNLCSLGNKNGCNAILKSDAAKLTSWLSWGEVGFFYFTGSVITLLINPGSLAIMSCLNLLALSYTIYSISYQYRYKNWCLLCCMVQGLLVIANIVAFSFGLWPFSFSTFSSSIFIQIIFYFLLPVTVWYTFKPFFTNSIQFKPLKLQLKKFKYNSELFKQVLINQSRYAIGDEMMPVTLGNPNAETVITMVSNPFCGPCAKAHQTINEWLKYRDDLQVKIIFTTADHDDDKKTKVSRHISALTTLNNADLLGKALNDWYAQGAQNYEIWAQKYPITFNGEMNEVTKKQKTWCDMAEIAFTPTILVNGYKLPAPYLLEDIKYLIT